jgi:peptidoglycan/LPS O-acetylase OafA/YrhL
LPGIAFFACAFGIAAIWYWHGYSGEKLEFELSYHTEIAGFGIFISAFFLLLFDGRRIPRLPLAAYPGLALIALMLRWWSVPLPVTVIVGVGALALLINSLEGAPQAVKSALSFYPLRKIGDWSFSIYLWQQPFYLAHHRSGLPAALAAALAICAGICSYYLIEKPMRNYLNAIWNKQTVSDSPPGWMPSERSD